MHIRIQDLPLRGALLAAALLLGYPALADDPPTAKPAAGRQDEGTKKTAIPAWLTEAREAMKRTDADGIALVVPDGKMERDAFRARIAKLLESPSLDLQEALLSAVFVCVPAASVDAKQGETAVLLRSGDGRRVAGCALDLASGDGFAKGVRRLLDTDGRFAARVKAARTKDVAADLAAAVGDGEAALAARTRLLDAFEVCAPAVITARAETRPDESARRSMLETLATSAFARRTAPSEYGGNVTQLPFGAQWTHAPVEGASEPDPCPPCGMAIVRRSEKVLLELLTRDDAAK